MEATTTPHYLGLGLGGGFCTPVVSYAPLPMLVDGDVLVIIVRCGSVGDGGCDKVGSWEPVHDSAERTQNQLPSARWEGQRDSDKERQRSARGGAMRTPKKVLLNCADLTQSRGWWRGGRADDVVAQ